MKIEIIVLSALLVSGAPAWAQSDKAPVDHGAHHAEDKKIQTYSEGEVRRIDKDAKKITLRHGPIVNLDMPAMTMVFQVTDAAMLDQVKVGDKVNFSAEKIAGAYVVTRLDPLK